MARSSSLRLNKKPVLVFDFDDTLINTRALKRDIFSVADRHGISLRQAKAAYARARIWPFTFHSFAHELWNTSRERRAVLRDCSALLTAPHHYTYPGALPMLRLLQKKYDLVLLTFGAASLQKKKIAQSGCARYFSRVIITDEPLKSRAFASLAATRNASAAIDDSRAVLQEARSYGLYGFPVRRGTKSARYFRALTKRILQRFPAANS